MVEKRNGQKKGPIRFMVFLKISGEDGEYSHYSKAHLLEGERTVDFHGFKVS